MTLKPLLKWPGGKFRASKRLAKLLPEHETYVEPFAGGASLFWNKPRSMKEVLGDLNDWLIGFYDDVRRGGLRGCKAAPFTRQQFERSKKCSSSCCKLMANRMSFHGNMKTLRDANPDGKPIAQHVLNELDQYESRLRHATLRISDYASTMEKYDSPKTVFYLDPPWITLNRTKAYSKAGYHGAETGFDLEKMAKVAAQMEGKVIIHYDDSPEARKIFQKAGLKLYHMEHKIGGNSSHTKDGRSMQLVATNYEIPKSKLKKKK